MAYMHEYAKPFFFEGGEHAVLLTHGFTGTPATVRSGSYAGVLEELVPGVEITAQACPLFVPLVENGYVEPDNEVTTLVAHQYLDRVKAAHVDTLIMGKTAKAKFFADANVQKMLDNRRMNLGEIAPRDLPNGVKYLGHLNDPSLDMYVYGEVYYDDWTNPDAPETKPLIPDNMIILISSRPNYMMAYGACTYIEDASGLWVTSQTSRVLRSYVEHHPDRRMVELQAHPLPIPDKVDSWLVATVC